LRKAVGQFRSTVIAVCAGSPTAVGTRKRRPSLLTAYGRWHSRVLRFFVPAGLSG
jgi:hypothetical protein